MNFNLLNHNLFNFSLISQQKEKYLKEEKTLTVNDLTQPFHLVDPSPWPILGAFSAFILVSNFGGYMHFFMYSYIGVIFGFILLITIAIMWWQDVVREATYEGLHSTFVLVGFKYGMLLFIISEVMLFFAFFWAYFHSSLNPTSALGCIWPPVGILPMNPWSIPLLNTIILLTSGATVTWAHYAMINGSRRQVILALITTVILAIIFTGFQGYEYVHATFNISDGAYGSTFYMATGLHGFHVLVGTIFLIVCFFRHSDYHFTRTNHIGFECAIWYWHFVDIVWIFLFISIYWWGA
jgi:heme/copper-type cytochrome/quinol oxidase subunit 3